MNVSNMVSLLKASKHCENQKRAYNQNARELVATLGEAPDLEQVLQCVFGVSDDTIIAAGGLDMIQDNPGLLWPRITQPEAEILAEALGVKSRPWLSGLCYDSNPSPRDPAHASVNRDARRMRVDRDQPHPWHGRGPESSALV